MITKLSQLNWKTATRYRRKADGKLVRVIAASAKFFIRIRAEKKKVEVERTKVVEEKDNAGNMRSRIVKYKAVGAEEISNAGPRTKKGLEGESFKGGRTLTGRRGDYFIKDGKYIYACERQDRRDKLSSPFANKYEEPAATPRKKKGAGK